MSEKYEEIERDETEVNVIIVRFEEKDLEGSGDEMEEKDIGEIRKRVTRSMTDAKRQEMRKEEK